MLGIVLIVPFTLLSLPYRICNRVVKGIKKDFDPPGLESGYFSEYLFIILVLDLALFCVYCMFAMWGMHWVKGKLSVFQVCGIIGYAAIAAGIFFWIRSYWLEWRDKRWTERMKKRYVKYYNPEPYVPKEPKLNVFVEFIKAWYKKHCPFIEWKE